MRSLPAVLYTGLPKSFKAQYEHINLRSGTQPTCKRLRVCNAGRGRKLAFEHGVDYAQVRTPFLVFIYASLYVLCCQRVSVKVIWFSISGIIFPLPSAGSD